MEQYKKEFIEFMVASNVLKFGDFTLKSGRKSPFFMNAGAYVNGTQLRRLGEYYARAINDHFGMDFDVLFGPAYKGIPLTVATTMALSELYGKEVRYCSNRKELKDHGDKGILLGTKLKDGDRVVIIEDVTTSGKSIEETYPILKAQANVEVVGLIVSLNRMEKGQDSDKSALDEIEDKYGFPTGAIVTMEEVVERLYNKPVWGSINIDDELKARIDAYYEQYGARKSKYFTVQCGHQDRYGRYEIDAWETSNNSEDAKVIAKVDPWSKTVEYLDKDAETDSHAQSVIKKVLEDVDNLDEKIKKGNDSE